MVNASNPFAKSLVDETRVAAKRSASSSTSWTCAAQEVDPALSGLTKQRAGAVIVDEAAHRVAGRGAGGAAPLTFAL